MSGQIDTNVNNYSRAELLAILDLDDNLAKEKAGKDSNFALLLHGTQEAGEKSKLKIRNETFAAYWKYRTFLNRSFFVWFS